VIKSIPVGKGPDSIGVNTKTNTIYVANSGNNTVSVIDGTTNTVIKRICRNHRLHCIVCRQLDQVRDVHKVP
jgi:YVTN family beta-propeller protein